MRRLGLGFCSCVDADKCYFSNAQIFVTPAQGWAQSFVSQMEYILFFSVRLRLALTLREIEDHFNRRAPFGGC